MAMFTEPHIISAPPSPGRREATKLSLTAAFPRISWILNSETISVSLLSRILGLVQQLGEHLNLVVLSRQTERRRNQCATASIREMLALQPADRLGALRWSIMDGHLSGTVERIRESSDLIIGESRGQARLIGSTATSLTESLLASSSPPVLAVPACYSGSLLAKRILIAFDGSPSADKAVDTALPFFRHATQVTVCAVKRYGNDSVGTEAFAKADALRALGICANAMILEGGGNPGDGATLLDRARNDDAEMIVSGAFVHPRWQQRLIGGVTKTLLSGARVPLLMTH